MSFRPFFMARRPRLTQTVPPAPRLPPGSAAFHIPRANRSLHFAARSRRQTRYLRMLQFRHHWYGPC
jgi:hypothetical protein